MKDKELSRFIARKKEELTRVAQAAMARPAAIWSELGSFTLVPGITMSWIRAARTAPGFTSGSAKEDGLHVCGELVISVFELPAMVAVLVCLPPEFAAPDDLEARGRRLLDLLGRGGQHLEIRWKPTERSAGQVVCINAPRLMWAMGGPLFGLGPPSLRVDTTRDARLPRALEIGGTDRLRSRPGGLGREFAPG